MKEKACYVALDYEKELWPCESYDYELSDRSHIILKDQRIRVDYERDIFFLGGLINLIKNNHYN